MDKEGKGLIEATLDAVRMRLRPILMTSLAFILGVMPLVISTGAGSGAQNAVGTGVMGGMVTQRYWQSSSFRYSLWWFAAALAARMKISSTAILSIIIDTTCNH